jgi:pimeloyl-ACP methyl ester carboxylesterase
MPDQTTPIVDYLEAGTGPCVVLAHSSVAGARQRRRLIAELKDSFHLRAVNLFGYGGTPPWSGLRRQAMDDQAALVEAAIPVGTERVSLVGHSFGGAVAMQAAARLGDRVERLALFEPNPFYLLKRHGRQRAFAEAMQVRDWIKTHGGKDDWMRAAELFADYWDAPGTWTAMSAERKAAFAEALKPNFHEWGTMEDEHPPLDEWAKLLPEATLVIFSNRSPRPIQEIVELFQEWCPHWQYERVMDGGHMAPLSRPDLVNPIIASFLALDITLLLGERGRAKR